MLNGVKLIGLNYKKIKKFGRIHKILKYVQIRHFLVHQGTTRAPYIWLERAEQYKRTSQNHYLIETFLFIHLRPRILFRVVLSCTLFFVLSYSLSINLVKKSNKQ